MSAFQIVFAVSRLTKAFSRLVSQSLLLVTLVAPCWSLGNQIQFNGFETMSQAHREKIKLVVKNTFSVVENSHLPIFDPIEATAPPVLEVFASSNDYHDAGGTPGSAARYLGSERKLIFQQSYLIREQADGKLSLDQRLLVHETIHLAMHRRQFELPQWLIEGICEYFAACHCDKGQFDFRKAETSIKRHLALRYRHVNSASYPTTSVSTLLSLDLPEWDQQVADLPLGKKHHPYTTALLLTHYLIHGSKSQQRKLLEYLKSPQDHDSLLNKEPQIIETQLARFWKSQGIALYFE